MFSSSRVSEGHERPKCGDPGIGGEFLVANRAQAEERELSSDEIVLR